jgi:hypothetical protein
MTLTTSCGVRATAPQEPASAPLDEVSDELSPAVEELELVSEALGVASMLDEAEFPSVPTRREASVLEVAAELASNARFGLPPSPSTLDPLEDVPHAESAERSADIASFDGMGIRKSTLFLAKDILRHGGGHARGDSAAHTMTNPLVRSTSSGSRPEWLNGERGVERRHSGEIQLQRHYAG